MNKTLKIILLALAILAVALAFYGFFPSQLQECPDEMIVDRMPGTSPQSSYYIDGGERREIEDYDAVWVEANCNIPVQEVY